MAVKRTTHRSVAGKKLYAVRDAEGQFKDIQTYERAHRQDLKRASKSEAAVAAKKTAQKAAAGKVVAKKVVAKKVVAKKTVARKTASKAVGKKR